MNHYTQHRGLYVFVPAYNEEKTLGKVLRDLVALKKSGLIQGIFVVDDGSKDRTGKIADSFKKFGVEVVHFKQNLGKAYAFYHAAKWAQQKGAKLFGMCDADLEKIPEHEFKKMLKAMEDPKVEMVLGEVYVHREGKVIKDFTNLTGQRIIRMKALKPLLIGQKTWLDLIAGINKIRKRKGIQIKHGRRGYGLEVALDYLIGWRKNAHAFWDTYGMTDCKNVRVAKTLFKALPVSSAPERKVEKARAKLVLEEPAHTYEKIKERVDKAEMVRELRKKRKVQAKPKALKYALRHRMPR